MKRLLPAILAVVLCAPAAFAAVEYEFHQNTNSEIEQIPSTDLTARAIIDGERSRVDFVGGTAYPPGTYVVSTNGSRTLVFVDPVSKSFTEINMAAATAALGSSKITIENTKADFETLDDHPIVAGYPTDHYRVTVHYDITLTVGSLPLKQAVETVVDKWTTTAFGDVGETFLSDHGMKTGNQKLDDLIDEETTKVKGLALKQRVEITTNNRNGVLPDSKLKINPMRKQTRDFLVTSIRRVDAASVSFFVPAAFHKTDPRQADPQQPKIHMLSLEPPSSK
ncbi:MAG: hypothetical protein ACXVIJ_01890 [Thermoanaerobaculia bacterium]